MKNNDQISTTEQCPKCGKELGEITLTKTGRKLQRCTGGSWDADTKKNVGCEFVKWLPFEPESLDEQCPKCGGKLILNMTRFGKKMKKCENGKWDTITKQTVGCDFVEWINGTTEPLEEECPDCGASLVLFTTNAGKKMKKCSTSGWDRDTRKATGCKYIYWLKPDEYPQISASGGEEFLPPEPAS